MVLSQMHVESAVLSAVIRSETNNAYIWLNRRNGFISIHCAALYYGITDGLWLQDRWINHDPQTYVCIIMAAMDIGSMNIHI